MVHGRVAVKDLSVELPFCDGLAVCGRGDRFGFWWEERGDGEVDRLEKVKRSCGGWLTVWSCGSSAADRAKVVEKARLLLLLKPAGHWMKKERVASMPARLNSGIRSAASSW